MALTGDVKALEAFGKRIRKLEGVPRVVAEKASPKVSALVTASFSAQSSPYGQGWVPTKSGAPAFGGGNALGRVLVRLVGKATLRTSVLYPLHFHNAGTKAGGKKTQAKIRKALAEGVKYASIKALTKVQAARLGYTPEDYEEHRRDIASANKFGRAQHRDRINAEVAARTRGLRGNMHDPARPMIPDDAEGIPKPWETAIRQAALEAMGRDLVTERR